MTRVRLLAEAEEDLSEAAAFLERRVEGLGERLAEAVEAALERLEENPRLGRPLRDGFRSLRVHTFPYNPIYRLRGDGSLVVAVAHHRRRPSFWRDRR